MICFQSIQLNKTAFGNLELNLDQILNKNQRIQEYSIPKSQHKILQIMKHSNNQQNHVQTEKNSQVFSRDRNSKQSLKFANERNQYEFLRQRQSYLKQYRDVLSRQKNLPQKIQNIIQDVRNIKQGLRVSRAKSNQKLAQSRQRIKSIGKNSISNKIRQSTLINEQVVCIENKKIESSPYLQTQNNFSEYGLKQYLRSQNNIKNVKRQQKGIQLKQKFINKNI